VPVVGGNVSLYNEGPDGPIYPTPVVGMVGELPDVTRAGRLAFAAEGDRIALIGPFAPSLPGSELAKLRGDELPRELPGVELGEVRVAQAAVRQAVRAGRLSSAHDIAEGGLAVALAESALAGGLGAEVDLGDAGDALTALFGEGPGGFVLSGSEEALAPFGTAARVIGTVGGDRLRIRTGEAQVDLAVDDLHGAHAGGLVEALT
jgi:phosphoribosylformylglycinamidine synthase